MLFIKDYKEFRTDPVIQKFWGHDQPTLRGMVSDEGVKADKYGRKIVPIGTFVDKDGKICKLTKSGFEGEPIGMTHDSKDVTHGPREVSLWVRGHFKGELINFDEDEYSDEIGLAIQEKFPEIHIYPIPDVNSILV